MDAPKDDIGSLDEEIENALFPLRKKFESYIARFEGHTESSLEANQKLAAHLLYFAQKLHVLFICPKCGDLARLVCKPNRTSKNGVFTFIHGSKTHGGTAKLPKLSIAPVFLKGQNLIDNENA